MALEGTEKLSYRLKGMNISNILIQRIYFFNSEELLGKDSSFKQNYCLIKLGAYFTHFVIITLLQ